MLKPTIKEDGKTKREIYLAKLIDTTFFGLWSFPSVYTDEGLSKNGSGKELCDLLLIFEDTVIIFSDKDIKYSDNNDHLIAWKRWFKKAVIKSTNQLYGAESWIKRFSNRLFLDTKCTKVFPIDLSSDNLKVHLIAVTCNSNKPAKKYFGGLGSSSLFQDFTLDAKECLEAPFVIGDIYPKKTFIHILDEFTLDLLISELNTVPDFVDYLQEKERAIRAGTLKQAAGEEEILAFFLSGREGIEKSGKICSPSKNSGKQSIALDEGIWERYLTNSSTKQYREINEKITLWDKLITRFSKHILNATVAHGVENDFSIHERAVRHLASENRLSRYYLSGAFEEKFLEIPEGRRSSRVVTSPMNLNKYYVFLFIPRDKGESEKDYRDIRSAYVQQYSLVTKYKYPKATIVVVIATETKGFNGHSEDLYSVDYEIPLTKEERKLAVQFSRDENILNEVSIQKSRVSLAGNVVRKSKSYTVKHGRNQSCPCGSGKKYKKCCLFKLEL